MNTFFPLYTYNVDFIQMFISYPTILVDDGTTCSVVYFHFPTMIPL